MNKRFTIETRAKVLNDTDGIRLDYNDKDFMINELSRFDPDTIVTVKITKWYKKRSLRQNNLLHAYIGIMADHFGYEVDEMKDLVRLKWLKEPRYDTKGDEMIDITTGEILFRLRSTTELDTLEMAELTAAIKIWAADGWGIYLPEPEEQMDFKFTNKLT